MSERVRVGVLGGGTVGSQLVELISTHSGDIEARTGVCLEVGAVVVRDLSKSRDLPPDFPKERLTDDVAAVVANPDIDLVVELVGGTDSARGWCLEALHAGQPVVTGNKALVAAHGIELFAAADDQGVDFLFEAAVGGGIPFMRPLRESLVGERIKRIMGIVNGTTNYVLSAMSDSGVSYQEALAQAQALGFAEADPSADVDGQDAAAKAAIMATIAFGQVVTSADVPTVGIGSITDVDIATAARFGYVIKLLAVVETHQRNGSTSTIGVGVHPAWVAMDHPLASVRGSFNAIFVEGESAGEIMFYGHGAGGRPTASAVLGDVVDAAMNLRRSSHAPLGTFTEADFVDYDQVVSPWSLDLDVVDLPGVLANVAGVLGENSVSIRSMEQDGLGTELARIILITHRARKADIDSTVHALNQLDVVGQVTSVIRVLDR